MPARSKPTIPAARLGRRLRKLREQAGLTQEEAAKALHYDQSKLSRIENGQVPDYHALCAMLDRYGLVVDDWRETLELHGRARTPGWWRGLGLDDETLVSLEDEASVVRDFMLGYVPGCLQIEPYVRALAEAGGWWSEKMVETIVRVRARRRSRLTDDRPMTLHSIIDASVFSRMPAHPEVMRAQLDHLAVATKLPNVSIRIVDETAGSHVGLVGSFTVLGFPDREDPDVAFVEHIGGLLRFDDGGVVERCQRGFRDLSALALDDEDSAAWMVDRAARL